MTLQHDPLLVASGVRKTYRTGAESVDALREIDLTIASGEFVSVMGASGSGKTTLLNCLSGLDDIDAGHVIVDGEDLHRMSDKARTKHRAGAMGFIFQSFNLIPVFTATENTELPLLLAGVAPKQARAAARSTLERVGLGHRLDHRPTELSGGEQQRVTIARALAGTPKIVWADEPTGNLDSETAASVMALLRDLHREGLTLVLVTHDEGIGASSQRRIHMRDGAIVSDERLDGAPVERVGGDDRRADVPNESTRPRSKPVAKRTPAKKVANKAANKAAKTPAKAPAKAATRKPATPTAKKQTPARAAANRVR